MVLICLMQLLEKVSADRTEADFRAIDNLTLGTAFFDNMTWGWVLCWCILFGCCRRGGVSCWRLRCNSDAFCCCRCAHCFSWRAVMETCVVLYFVLQPSSRPFFLYMWYRR